MNAVASRKRLWTRFPLVVGLALAALTVVSSAQPAGIAEAKCLGTVTLEEVVIANDTDPNPPWRPPDRWTYHTRTYMAGHLGVHDDLYGLIGDTGYIDPVHLVVIDSKDVGKPGDEVQIRVNHMAKERDMKSGKTGVFPRDQGETGFRHNETCQAGTFPFSSFVKVRAQPAPPDPTQEHDGELEFRWTVTFEIQE